MIYYSHKQREAETPKKNRRRSTTLFDYVTDAFRGWDSLPDYDEIDNEWCITLIEISDGGAEKILASTSVWESELAKEWFNN